MRVAIRSQQPVPSLFQIADYACRAGMTVFRSGAYGATLGGYTGVVMSWFFSRQIDRDCEEFEDPDEQTICDPSAKVFAFVTIPVIAAVGGVVGTACGVAAVAWRIIGACRHQKRD